MGKYLSKLNCCHSSCPKEIISPPKEKPWPTLQDIPSIPTVPYQDEIVDVLVYSVYDGDTCSILLPFNDDFLKLKIRVLGVDAPELHIKGEQRGTYLANLEEQAGEFVRDRVKKLIEGKVCKVRLDKWDKYGGRVDGEIFLDRSSGYFSLGEFLLNNNYAKPYSGAKKSVWTKYELDLILKDKK